MRCVASFFITLWRELPGSLGSPLLAIQIFIAISGCILCTILVNLSLDILALSYPFLLPACAVLYSFPHVGSCPVHCSIPFLFPANPVVNGHAWPCLAMLLGLQKMSRVSILTRQRFEHDSNTRAAEVPSWGLTRCFSRPRSPVQPGSSHTTEHGEPRQKRRAHRMKAEFWHEVHSCAQYT